MVTERSRLGRQSDHLGLYAARSPPTPAPALAPRHHSHCSPPCRCGGPEERRLLQGCANILEWSAHGCARYTLANQADCHGNLHGRTPPTWCDIAHANHLHSASMGAFASLLLAAATIGVPTRHHLYTAILVTDLVMQPGKLKRSISVATECRCYVFILHACPKPRLLSADQQQVSCRSCKGLLSSGGNAAAHVLRRRCQQKQASP